MNLFSIEKIFAPFLVIQESLLSVCSDLKKTKMSPGKTLSCSIFVF